MNLIQKAIGYLARSIGLTDPRLVQAACGRTTTTGELVSTSSVLGLASAWACVNLLAGTIASLPLMVYRTTDHFTAGATVKLKNKLELTGYVMHAPRNDVRGAGSIPLGYGGGEANVHLAETAVGASLGFLF